MIPNITEGKSLIPSKNQPEALEFILSNSFRSGFGTLSKTELDLILFAAILKFADRENTSDHALSKFLQITQARVRNLKEKVSVKYMIIDKKEAIDLFTEKVKNAKFDGLFIDIPINDVAIKNEIEAVLDQHNILLHTQLNPKIFRIRIDDFLEFSVLIEMELQSNRNREEIEKKLIKTIQENKDLSEKLQSKIDSSSKGGLSTLTKETLKSALVKGGISFGVDFLASLVPGGVFVASPVKDFLKTLSGKV